MLDDFRSLPTEEEKYLEELHTLLNKYDTYTNTLMKLEDEISNKIKRLDEITWEWEDNIIDEDHPLRSVNWKNWESLKLWLELNGYNK